MRPSGWDWRRERVSHLQVTLFSRAPKAFVAVLTYKLNRNYPGHRQVRMKDLLRPCMERQVAGLAFLPPLLDEPGGLPRP